MATLIIEMDGGLVNEVYSTLLEPLNIQVYDTDDRRDPEHAYLYAASTYALQFGGMRPQFRRGHDYSDRIWGALERRPESAALVSDLRRPLPRQGSRPRLKMRLSLPAIWRHLVNSRSSSTTSVQKRR